MARSKPRRWRITLGTLTYIVNGARSFNNAVRTAVRTNHRLLPQKRFQLVTDHDGGWVGVSGEVLA